MSNIIELKAYHLSELVKEHSGNTTEIENVLGKVEKFKELDLKKNIEMLEDSLKETLSLKLLDQLDSVFQLIDESHGANLLLLNRIMDLKPMLVNLEMELIAKIEYDLLKELDEMINMFNRSMSDRAKPDVPTRSNTSPTTETKKDLIQNNSNSLPEVQKENNHSHEKDIPPQKMGSFSKMLTHLTKARPKANRSKRNDSNQVHIDSVDSSRDEFQKEDDTDNSFVSKDQDNSNQVGDIHSGVEPISSTIANLAHGMYKGKESGKNMQESPSKDSYPDKVYSSKINADDLPNKPGRPNEQAPDAGKPAPAPRPAKPNAKADENVENSHAKPRLAPRPPKSIAQGAESLNESKNVPNETISSGTKSIAENSFEYDIADKPVSNILSRIPMESTTSTVERPKSDIQASSPKDQRTLTPMVEAGTAANSKDNNPISAPIRISGMSNQHGAIGALAAAVTGRKITASDRTNSDLTTDLTPEFGGIKPAPPKRPVKNIANDTQKSNDTGINHPTPRAGSAEKIITDRPRSEVITATENSSPIDFNRPMSMIEESSGFKEDNIGSAPPKRIPGVYATQHGAIGALAAAVTGRRHNSISTHSESGSSITPSRNNSITPTTVSPNATAHEENTIIQDAISNTAGEGLENHRGPISPVNSISFVSSVPMTFKKKDSSLSGDDKGIEKSALDWLNQHLTAKNIHIDNLYDSLADGLNLIYAIEDATKEPVGKYNKRTMLPVHKIDNLSVALTFLTKKGVDVQFITPQDIMDGNKGKILTLFVGILKL